jgi:hypothetical protein
MSNDALTATLHQMDERVNVIDHVIAYRSVIYNYSTLALEPQKCTNLLKSEYVYPDRRA